ncbi:MAG: GNAT family N-acetyltransferase [Roseibium sp.]
MSSSSTSNPASQRLTFRRPTPEDAAFYLKLMNEPDYIRFITDHGIRSEADALSYIEAKSLARFEKHGVGLWVFEITESTTPVGVCGLVVRDGLDYPDLGYGFLEAFRGKGYAREAGQAVLEFAQSELNLKTLCAITDPENTKSSRLLEKIGFVQNGQKDLAEIGEISDYFIWRSA